MDRRPAGGSGLRLPPGQPAPGSVSASGYQPPGRAGQPPRWPAPSSTGALRLTPRPTGQPQPASQQPDGPLRGRASAVDDGDLEAADTAGDLGHRRQCVGEASAASRRGRRRGPRRRSGGRPPRRRGPGVPTGQQARPPAPPATARSQRRVGPRPAPDRARRRARGPRARAGSPGVGRRRRGRSPRPPQPGPPRPPGHRATGTGRAAGSQRASAGVPLKTSRARLPVASSSRGTAMSADFSCTRPDGVVAVSPDLCHDRRDHAHPVQGGEELGEPGRVGGDRRQRRGQLRVGLAGVAGETGVGDAPGWRVGRHRRERSARGGHPVRGPR